MVKEFKIMKNSKKKENNLPKIAVLMTAYNGELWIDKQISSILNQKSVLLELFISIDLSTDKTFNICQTIKNEYSNVHILEYGKRFGSASKNFLYLFTVINFKKFDYISLSDQDDIWYDRKLARAISCIGLKKCNAYSSNVTPFSDKKKYPVLFKSDPQKKFDYLFEGGGPGCTYVFDYKLAKVFNY